MSETENCYIWASLFVPPLTPSKFVSFLMHLPNIPLKWIIGFNEILMYHNSKLLYIKECTSRSFMLLVIELTLFVLMKTSRESFFWNSDLCIHMIWGDIYVSILRYCKNVKNCLVLQIKRTRQEMAQCVGHYIRPKWSARRY